MERLVWSPLGSPLRWALVAGTWIGALAHLPVIAPHLREAPYMGLEFIVLTLACAALGAAALISDSRAVYALTIATCGLAVIGYALTRLVAFPLVGDDVGNWFEPLGVVSVLAEIGAVAVAATALLKTRRA